MRQDAFRARFVSRLSQAQDRLDALAAADSRDPVAIAGAAQQLARAVNESAPPPLAASLLATGKPLSDIGLRPTLQTDGSVVLALDRGDLRKAADRQPAHTLKLLGEAAQGLLRRAGHAADVAQGVAQDVEVAPPPAPQQREAAQRLAETRRLAEEALDEQLQEEPLSSLTRAERIAAERIDLARQVLASQDAVQEDEAQLARRLAAARRAAMAEFGQAQPAPAGAAAQDDAPDSAPQPAPARDASAPTQPSMQDRITADKLEQAHDTVQRLSGEQQEARLSRHRVALRRAQQAARAAASVTAGVPAADDTPHPPPPDTAT